MTYKRDYKRDLQKRPTKETYKRDLQKRPTKETYKRDLQKSTQLHSVDYMSNVAKETFIDEKRPLKIKRDPYESKKDLY